MARTWPANHRNAIPTATPKAALAAARTAASGVHQPVHVPEPASRAAQPTAARGTNSQPNRRLAKPTIRAGRSTVGITPRGYALGGARSLFVQGARERRAA